MITEKFEEGSMSEIMEHIDKTMKPVHSGDIIEGEVISVSEKGALVNIGYMADGIIDRAEVSEEEVNPTEILNPGDKITVYVLKANDGEGNVVLSKRKADAIKVWDELKESFKKETLFEVNVSEVVKGGVTCYIKGIRAFIPASHVSNSFVKDLNEFKGKNLLVKIIEFERDKYDKDKYKIVLSRKEVEKKEEQAKKDELWSALKKGEKRAGVVSRLAKFGAFVDLGGMDGLIHNSDLSWKRVNDPSEVVNVGDAVEIYVLDFDKEKGRISLGLKDVKENPWNNAATKYKINDVVEGKVVRLTDFGAFVELEPGFDGLVHISQITDDHIAKPAQVLNIGDKVKVKILELNVEGKKMALSIKEADTSVKEELDKYNKDNDEGNFLFADLFKNMKF